MKRIINILLVLAAVFSISSCFFDDDTVLGKADVSKIELVTEFNELTFLAMDVPNFGVKVNQSGEKRELNYEWSLGKLNEGSSGYIISGERVVISNDSLLTYQFPHLGKYVLRLIVDNGEDVQIKVFNLNVSAGYDEGLAVLTKDESNKGHLSFLKTLTEQDIANGVEESVISEFYPDLLINNPQAITSPYNKAIYIADGDGRILVFDQQTMALDMISRPEQLNGGDYVTSFSSYIYSKSSDRLACYCFTKDRKVYRYDSRMGELSTFTTSDKYVQFAFEDIDAETLLENNYRYPFFINYTKSTITSVYGNYGYFDDYSENYKIIAVGYPYNDSSSYLFIIASLKSDPSKYVILKEYKYLDRASVLATYDLPAEFTVSKDTKFINSDEYDDYLYYVYNNKIYRWDYKHNDIPSVGEALPFDIPEGEEIVKMCFNGDKEGTKLFVCTYNPSRSTELKGSIYVYHPDSFQRINAFEGVTHRAVDLVYKKI
jgi:hypothetical protein